MDRAIPVKSHSHLPVAITLGFRRAVASTRRNSLDKRNVLVCLAREP